MTKKLTYFIAGCLAVALHQAGFSQEEDEFDSLLIRQVYVENPVYKPVIGFGAGVTNFLGDVTNGYLGERTNSNPNLMMGTWAFKVSVSTFLARSHSLVGNFYLINGSLTGNQRSYEEPLDNKNFQSDIMAFGLNVEYGFSHFFAEPEGILRPFVSFGIENLSFNSKVDLSFRDTLGVDQTYHYWTDGTIRNIDESQKDLIMNSLLYRDYIPDKDLRDIALSDGFGDYSKNTFAFPVELGIDFRVNSRVKMRLGASLHPTLSDAIDNVSIKRLETSENGEGSPQKDNFTFMYLTMHLDLFSEPKVITEELMFADYGDFDYSLYEDEDGDGVFDLSDDCLGTPPGIEVDTLGCPYDDDNDGVPNFQDKQPDTPDGAFVGDDGVEISEETLIERVNFTDAVPRSQLALYLEGTITSVRRMTLAEMPEKFHKLDIDGDNYLSFDEMLTSIDDFFDFRSDLNTGEVYRLISFFFAQ
jgi:hypothetical protein